MNKPPAAIGDLSSQTSTFEHKISQANAMLKALANQHRLMVLCLLMGKELCVTELNQNIPLSQSALSQHLAWLRKAGIVTTRRQNQTIFYRICSDEVRAIIHTLHSLYCEKSQ